MICFAKPPAPGALVAAEPEELPSGELLGGRLGERLPGGVEAERSSTERVAAERLLAERFASGLLTGKRLLGARSLGASDGRASGPGGEPSGAEGD